jgi:hypothetical protein
MWMMSAVEGCDSVAEHDAETMEALIDEALAA